MDIFKQKYESLTRLVRLYKKNPNNLKYLKKTIHKYLDTNATLAVTVAQESGDPIGKILSECLAQSDNHNLLVDVYEKLPANSVALREVHLVVAKRMVELTKANHTNDWLLLAQTTATYAEALADVGEREFALELAQESACLRLRHLSIGESADVDALVIFARCLTGVGRLDHAILVQAYVIEQYDRLDLLSTPDNITAYANNLLIMSSYQRMRESCQEAIRYGQMAMEVVEELPDIEAKHRYIKHRITRNLADCYDAVDNLPEARALLKDSIQLIDDLVSESADRYELELIDTFETLASIEARLGNKEQAEDNANKAITRLKAHYQDRDKAFAGAYSTLLTNMGLVDLATKELTSAQLKMDKAVDILEPLTKQYPERFSLNLAAVLNNRVEVLLALNRHKEAVQDAQSALMLYQSQSNQQANIAMALNTLANASMQNSQIEKAQHYMQESIQIYRQLIESDDYFRTDLAITLGTLATINEQVEDYPAALEVADAALSYWNEGAKSVKDANAQAYNKVATVRLSSLIELEEYDKALVWSEHMFKHLHENRQLGVQPLADAYSLHANLQYLMEQRSESILTAQKGIALLRSLPINEIPSYKVDLADALGNLCFLQAEENQLQALETVKEAARLYQELPAEALTVSMVFNMAVILQNLGSMAQACEQYDLGLQSFQKAVFYQRQIINEHEDFVYDLITLLQLLLNLQVITSDMEFKNTLKELRLLLNDVAFDAEVEELLQSLQAVETNFLKKQGGD